jgi:hypothetical protein
MAPNPVFVSELAALKAQLRLSGVSEGSDAHAMLEAAILQVRSGFYSRLGSARVAELVAITPVPAPTTDNQILRAIGALCEVLWIRMILLDKLPVLFMDNAGGDQEFINQEGTFRSITPERLDRERLRMETQIEEWLALLAGEVSVGNAPDVQVHTQVDQQPRLYPFGTLLGDNPRLWGDPTRTVPGEVTE